MPALDVIVQTLIETMMTGNVVLLAAFGAEPKNGSSTVLKIVFDLQIHDRADPAAGGSKLGEELTNPLLLSSPSSYFRCFKRKRWLRKADAN
jgi:hypothetical protein